MYSTSVLSVAAVLMGLTTPGKSWQTEVHDQIGFMADTMLSERAHYVVDHILEPQYKGQLGRAAGWADEVRRTTHKYSYGWHFISAKDNPPDDCGLYYHRDCQAGGCVVQQIANQTRILEGCIEELRDGSEPKDIKCSEALKWIAHFTGDVAQPLHTSERSYGGNSIKVLFNGTQTNLHSAWDKEILYALTNNPNGFPTTELHPYFVGLVDRIREDAFRSPRSTWAMCDLDARRGTYCAEQWAKDSNAIVCDYAYGVLVNGSDLLTGDDKYAQGALHIIEEQMAKAAWRLSGWLNVLAARVLDGNHSTKDENWRLLAQGGSSPVEAEL